MSNEKRTQRRRWPGWKRSRRQEKSRSRFLGKRTRKTKYHRKCSERSERKSRAHHLRVVGLFLLWWKKSGCCAIMIFVFFATTLTYTLNFIFEYFHIENIQISNIKNKLVYGNYSFVLIYFLMGGFLYKYNVYEKYTDKKILIRIISILLMILGIIGLVLMKKHFDGTFKWKNI